MALQAQQTVIRIGHPAYPRNGANAAKYCFSKAEAVRVLRDRGITRDVARAKVNDVCSKFGGYATVSERPYGEVIEVGNYTGDYHPF
ncbi:MAG TPA: hypothetical protein VF783_13935 [Terriglobales bacterium]